MKLKSTFSAPLLVILIMMLLIVSRFVDFGSLAYQENICLAVIVMQLVLVVVPTMFYTKMRGESFAGRLRLAPIGIEKLLVTLLAALTLILGDTLLKLGLYNIGAIDGAFTTYHYYLGGSQPGVLYSLITFAALPAVIEEVLFRSLLCAEYEGSGVAAAVLGSAGLYAMFSMDFGYFPVFLLAGLIFALVMYLTGSLFAAILCHFCYNLFQLGVGETVRTIITKPQSVGFLVFSVTALFLLCLAALFGECERIYYGYSLAGKKPEHVNPAAGVRSFAEAMLAPPYLVAFIVFLVAAIQF